MDLTALTNRARQHSVLGVGMLTLARGMLNGDYDNFLSSAV